jgi:hypothetical protein
MVVRDYKGYIAELMEKHGLGELFEDVSSIRSWLQNYEIGLVNDGYFVDYGASRGVIGRTDWDFVFKFVYDLSDDIDYCANEAFIYEKAKEYGIQECFAKTFCVGTFDGVDVYVMERCECNMDKLSDDSWALQFKKYCDENNLDENDDEAMEQFSEYDCDSCEDQEAMLDLAEETWGHTLAHNVREFMEEFYVNDCHCGNWGWAGERFVVVDYSGYGEYAIAIAKMRGVVYDDEEDD